MAGVTLAQARMAHHAPRLARFKEIFMRISGKFDISVSHPVAQDATH
ncbi:MAG TPA: hypothetical protein VF797_08130 [Noviherbaspirillum sp.]